MKIGLLGLPRSGKTTVFSALTRLESAAPGRSNGKAEPNMAMVKVLEDGCREPGYTRISMRTSSLRLALVIPCLAFFPGIAGAQPQHPRDMVGRRPRERGAVHALQDDVRVHADHAHARSTPSAVTDSSSAISSSPMT